MDLLFGYSMSTVMYIDAEYLGAAAYHYGLDNGLKRAKVDYLALKKQYSPEQAVVYVAPADGRRMAFQKFLAGAGYIVQRMPNENHASGITAQMTTDINAHYLDHSPRRVVVVTGNGSIAPLCRVLQSHCELIVLGLPGSVSKSLHQVGVNTDVLPTMLYDAAT